MSLVVVDASVGAKWFLPGSAEGLTDQAFALLDRYDRNEVRFIVPDLYYVEIASAIWKTIRTGRLTRAAGGEVLRSLMEWEFPTMRSVELLDKAFEIATHYQRTVYDCLYVALAVQSEAQLITADEHLATALAAHFPVKWLGAT